MSDLDISGIIDEVFNSSSSGTDSTPIAESLSLNGVTSNITKVYVAGEGPTDVLYSGSEYGIDAGDEIPIVYGEILLSGQLIEGAIERSEIEPDRLIRRYVVRMGDGENAGLSNSSSQNLFVNCMPTTDDNGAPNFGDIVVRELVGSTAKNVIGGMIPKLIFGDQDPKTGKDILGIKDPKKQEALAQSSEALAAGYPGAIMAYDEALCGWSAKSFVTAFTESGITAEKIVVKQDGTQKSADVIGFNFTGGATVTDNGDRTVTITGGGGEANGQAIGTGEPVYKNKSGNTLNFKNIKGGYNVTVSADEKDIYISAFKPYVPRPTTDALGCSYKYIPINFDPVQNSWYLLRRNDDGRQPTVVDNVPQITTRDRVRVRATLGMTREGLAKALAQSDPYSPEWISYKYYFDENDSTHNIQIGRGTDKCLVCDTGTYSIYTIPGLPDPVDPPPPPVVEKCKVVTPSEI